MEAVALAATLIVSLDKVRLSPVAALTVAPDPLLGECRATARLLLYQLRPAPHRAVGKLHALRAHPGPGQGTVELDAVARGPVRQIEIA